MTRIPLISADPEEATAKAPRSAKDAKKEPEEASRQIGHKSGIGENEER